MNIFTKKTVLLTSTNGGVQDGTIAKNRGREITEAKQA